MANITDCSPAGLFLSLGLQSVSVPLVLHQGSLLILTSHECLDIILLSLIALYLTLHLLYESGAELASQPDE